MKVQVKIDNHIHEVEILDLQSRPVIANVDGQRLEVWPENGVRIEPTAAVKPSAKTESPLNPPPSSSSGGPQPAALQAGAVLAPIPGVIVAILVKEGDEVAYGQDLCIIEAMKMRNAIKAAHAGQIAAVRVSVGQTVNHHDVLIEFGE
jgi:biotin carboxyl carrier protein